MEEKLHYRIFAITCWFQMMEGENLGLGLGLGAMKKAIAEIYIKKYALPFKTGLNADLKQEWTIDNANTFRKVLDIMRPATRHLYDKQGGAIKAVVKMEITPIYHRKRSY